MPALFRLLLALLVMTPQLGQAAGVIFQQVTAAEYQQVRKAARPGKTTITFPVRKQSTHLTIPTSAGPMVLQDQLIGEDEVQQGCSEEEHTVYTYRGYLTHFHRHVVEVTYYKTSQWWLIGEDGRRLTLWGKPLYAPDQNSIITICPGLAYSSGQPNALQLFQLKSGVLQKVWETQPTSWEPEEIFWTSANSLYLKRASFNDDTRSSTYWKLTIT